MMERSHAQDRHSERAGRLEACFATIAATRMDGVPICNPDLAVRVSRPVEVAEATLCTLLTPWFLNLVILPPEGAERVRTGETRAFAFPGGRFEFMAGFEEEIGPYWMCSLFSPVFEFKNQETAIAAADAALEAVLSVDDEPDAIDDGMETIWRGEWPDAPETEASATSATVAEPLDRRAFLTGRSRRSEAEAGE